MRLSRAPRRGVIRDRAATSRIRLHHRRRAQTGSMAGFDFVLRSISCRGICGRRGRRRTLGHSINADRARMASSVNPSAHGRVCGKPSGLRECRERLEAARDARAAVRRDERRATPGRGRASASCAIVRRCPAFVAGYGARRASKRAWNSARRGRPVDANASAPAAKGGQSEVGSAGLKPRNPDAGGLSAAAAKGCAQRTPPKPAVGGSWPAAPSACLRLSSSGSPAGNRFRGDVSLLRRSGAPAASQAPRFLPGHARAFHDASSIS